MALSVASAPQPPYILYGHIEWNNAPYSGATVDISYMGATHSVVTDGNGLWTSQIDSYMDNTPVSIRVDDGCGTGDTCSKSITIGSAGYEAFAEVDISLSGVLTCPPVSCPSCSGGGSSCSYSETRCNSLYPTTNEECTDVWYETGVCPAVETCPAEKVCATCETCPEVSGECPEPVVPDDTGGIIGWIVALIAFIGGGFKIYKNRAGGITMLHRHKGILGYHNPNTSHQKKIYRHARFSDDPVKFAKDVKKIEEQGGL